MSETSGFVSIDTFAPQQATDPDNSSYVFRRLITAGSLAVLAACSAGAPAQAKNMASAAPVESPVPDVTNAPTSLIFAGEQMLTLPDNPARLWLQTHPNDINKKFLTTIENEPTTRFLYQTGPAMIKVLKGTVADAKREHKVAVIADYVLTDRDCGGNSAGGAKSVTEYKSFIDQVVATLGQTKAIIDVEPDGPAKIVLPGQTYKSCMSPAQQKVADTEISYAVDNLQHDRNAFVAVDGGNDTYRSASDMAQILIHYGVTKTVTNLSNYHSPQAEDAFMEAVGENMRKDTNNPQLKLEFAYDSSRVATANIHNAHCNPNASFIADGHPATLTNDLFQGSAAAQIAYIKGNLVGGSDGNGKGCINTKVAATCPPIGAAGTWNPCIAVEMEKHASNKG